MKPYNPPLLKPVFEQTVSTNKLDYVILDEMDEETIKDIEDYFQKKKLKPKKFKALDMDV